MNNDGKTKATTNDFPSDGSEIRPAPLESADWGPGLDSGCVHNSPNYKFVKELS